MWPAVTYVPRGVVCETGLVIPVSSAKAEELVVSRFGEADSRRPKEPCRLLKRKGSSCSIAERRIPELIPVLGSQPASYVSHKSGGRLPLLSARPAVTLATFKRAARNFAA